MNVDVEQIVRDNIDRTVHMSLATVRDNAPWVCEVHFAYDQKLDLYFRSLKSRRHSQEITDNANVAGNIIDKYGLGEQVIGLYFEGQATLLETGDEQQLAADCLRTRLRMDQDILREAADDDGHQLYKVSVSTWYVFGRFGGETGRKYAWQRS